MKMTGQRPIIFCVVLLALGLGIGLYPYLPVGPSVMDAHVIEKGSARADIEVSFGPPLVVGPWTDGSHVCGMFGVWELRDGWMTISFDLDDRAQMTGAYTQDWVIRKRERLRWALGW